MSILAKIITINVQKGGVGKTTVTHEFASNLKRKGYKVLAIDLDQQLNLSKCSGAPLTEYYSIYEVLKGDCDFVDAIHEGRNYDICTAHKKLESVTKDFSIWDVYKLADKLKPCNDVYDFIIIDTPPGFSILSDMALTASDYVIVPLEAAAFSMQGLGQLFERIEQITNPERGSNKNLKIAGLVLTKYSDRTKLEKNVREQLESFAKRMNTKVLNTAIRKGVAVEEAQAFKMSVLEHAPNSKPCLDFINFTNEVLKEIENNG